MTASNPHGAWRVALTMITALACMAPSMAINAVHQFTHTPGPMAWPLAAAAALSVLLAGCAPFAMRRAREERDPGLRLIAWTAFLICAAYNLSSAIGAASVARSDVAGARAADNARAALLAGQIAQAEKSRASLASTAGEQTPAMADAALLALRQDRLWSRSKECADATLEDSRAFCAGYAQKQAVRDAAAKVEALDRGLAALKSQLLAAGTAPGQPVDPQAESVATALSFLGARVSQVGLGLNLWFALTIEALGALGPIVFGSLLRRRGASGRAAEPVPAQPIEPACETADKAPPDAPDISQETYSGLRLVSGAASVKPSAPAPRSVEAWLAAATCDRPGAELRGSDALRAYRRWSGDAGGAMSPPQFRKELGKALGRQRRTRIVIKNSGFVIRDMALKPVNVPADVDGDVDADVGGRTEPAPT
jgi:hypothetical protein